jgi:hypothetical protein
MDLFFLIKLAKSDTLNSNRNKSDYIARVHLGLGLKIIMDGG